MSGRKNDADKPISGTVMQDFGNALTAVSVVGTFGAKKYAKSNWLKVDRGIERYTDAMMRHFLAEPYEAFDPDSNIIHAAHTAWNALARLELMLRAGSNITDVGGMTPYERETARNLEVVWEDRSREGTDASRQVPPTVYHSHGSSDRNAKEDTDEDTLGSSS